MLAGFSDQLARRLDAGTLRCELVHQRRGVLARESAIQKSPLLVAAEISEVGGRGGEVNVLLSLATAIEEAWLKEIFPDDYREVCGVTYDETARRVVSRRERRFRDLVLDAKVSSDDAPLNEAAALRAEAESLLNLYRSKQEQAVKDAEDILAQAKAEAELMRKNAEADLKRSLAAREAQAKDRIALAEQAAIQQVKVRAVEIAVRAATGLVKESIDQSGAAALVDHAIDDLPQRAKVA